MLFMQELFRKEVLEHKQHTWLGDILITRPKRFSYFVGLFVSITLVITAYLVWGEYTKKAHVSGYV